jgi:hypothetical protein
MKKGKRMRWVRHAAHTRQKMHTKYELENLKERDLL